MSCIKYFAFTSRGSRYEEKPLDYHAEFVELVNSNREDREDIVSLEFFADSDILKGIFLIDTPGTRSVEEEHEKTARDFLAEAETLEHTNRADAIIYTVQHNLRGGDKEFLTFFGDQTKLQTAFPNNSIAVVQLWDREEDSWGEALEKQCDTLRRLLERNVSVVLPTSAMLAIAASPDRISLDTWQQLAKLGACSDEDPRDTLLFDRKFFGEFYGDLWKSVETENNSRPEWKFHVWTLIRFSLWFAHSKKIDDGESLQQALWRESGIDELKNVLQERFLSKAHVLKVSNGLQRIIQPCERAILKLGELQEALEKPAEERGLKILHQSPYKDDTQLDDVRNYVEKARIAVEERKKGVENTKEKLLYTYEQALDNYESFSNDLESLIILEEESGSTVPEETTTEDFRANTVKIECLLGKYGTAVWRRLRLESDNLSNEVMLDKAWELYEYLSESAYRKSGRLRKIYEHAARRCMHLIDDIEQKDMVAEEPL